MRVNRCRAGRDPDKHREACAVEFSGSMSLALAMLCAVHDREHDRLAPFFVYLVDYDVWILDELPGSHYQSRPAHMHELICFENMMRSRIAATTRAAAAGLSFAIHAAIWSRSASADARIMTLIHRSDGAGAH